LLKNICDGRIISCRDRFLPHPKVAEFSVVDLHAVIEIQRDFHVDIVPQGIVKFGQLDPLIFRCGFFPLHCLLPIARCPLVHSCSAPFFLIFQSSGANDGFALRGQAVFLQTAFRFIRNCHLNPATFNGR
jgi:hypothetical protein